MKKNKMMRAASALLVAVLLTTSVISGTFAKYVTKGEATDSARVAKWGVVVNATGDNFSNKYVKHDDDSTFAYTVESTEKVVAPGTDGNLVTVALTGKPEVAVEVSYEAELEYEGWKVTGDFDGDGNVETEETDVEYFPLVFKVNGVEKAASEVVDTINAYKRQYQAGTDLSTIAESDFVDVEWEWEFSTSEANDVKDTALGNAAANGNAPTVTLTVKTIVTQID